MRVYYEGPYATNLVPVRDEVEEAKKNLPNWPESEWANDFWDELKVVDPILIVAEGEKVVNALSRLPGLNVRFERVTHHSYRNLEWQPEAVDTLQRELERVRRVYDRLKKQL